jgi:hypothetical protein
MEISGIIFIEKGNIDCIHLYKPEFGIRISPLGLAYQ